jgi:hypothetical protein
MDRVKVALGFYREGVKEEVIDCTNDLKNWDDVTISLNRSDYTGVVRAISTKFEFVGETKSKIDAYYEEGGEVENFFTMILEEYAGSMGLGAKFKEIMKQQQN